MIETLAAWSLVGVYSAAVVYAIAFVIFVFDLGKRSAAPGVASRVHSQVAASAGSTAVLEKVDAPPAVPAAGASRYARTALALTAVGWAVHLTAIVLRGVAAQRVPWANMFEFAMTGTGIIVGVFLFANLWKDLRFLGVYILGLVVILMTLATANLYVDVLPIPPALQSAWLVIHVLMASMATGFFSLGAGISVVQLVQSRREAGHPSRLRFLRTIPSSEHLERLAYRVIVIGFALWTVTLIFGAIWAERAWGRYWGWDTKEVWTFVIWVVFAGYVHARATRDWRGTRSAVLAIIGFAAVLFNFVVVNLFFKGLHAYSGL